MCDLDPKVKVIGKKAGICDGVPSTAALVIINIDFLKLNLSFLSNTFSSSAMHKLKFWTGIRQKIRCGMALVGMDS